MIVGAWVRKDDKHGDVKEVHKDYLVVKLSTGERIRIDLHNPDGWQVFSTVWEEGHWEPIESQ